MNKTMEYMAFELPGRRVRPQGDPCLGGRRRRRTSQPNDVGEYARAIGELLDDPSAARSMGQQGRQRVVDVLAWRHQAPRYIDIYRRLLGSREELHRDAARGPG